MQHRRLTIPAALVGAAGIALAPAFAEASTVSQTTTTTHSAAAVTAGSAKAVSAALAKAVGFKTFASRTGHTVHVAHGAAKAAATDPNPDLAITVGGGDTSAFGVELDISVTGLNTGSATITVDWGDSTTSTVAYDQSEPSINVAHQYTKLGTYNITATADDGAGDTSAETIPDATTGGSEYTAYGPVRILDTRSGIGEAKAAPIAANHTLSLKVTGAGPAGKTIPAGVTAVVLNVTAVSPTANGVLTVYGDQDASGDALGNPGTSNVNFRTGQNVPNLVVAPVGANGVVDIANSSTGSTQVLADVAGYFTQANTNKYVAITPARILDTRDGIGTGGTVAKIPANGSITLNVAGSDGGAIPASGVSAVALNLTAVDSTKNGVITAYPAGQSLPTVSNLNYSAGQTEANLAIVPVGGNGQVVFHNNSSGPVDLLADANGYYSGTTTASTASAYAPLDQPFRVLDTRSNSNSPIDLPGPLDTGATYGVEFTPFSYATGEVFNATVVQGTGNGFLSLYPYNPADPSAVPSTSNLNYRVGQTIPNLAIVPLGTTADANGAYDFGIYLGGKGTSQVILDWFGEYEDQ